MSEPKFDPSLLKRDKGAMEEVLRSAGCRQKGNTQDYHCSLHGDGKDVVASARLYCDDGMYYYYCNGCARGGDYFEMSDRVAGLPAGETFRRAATEFYQRFGGKKVEPERVYKTVESAIEAIGGALEGRWDYTDSDTGAIDLVIVRLREGEGKTFRQITPRVGGWARTGLEVNPIYNRKGIRNAAYVVVCEGEKSADALIKLGIPATTSPEGALKGHKANWMPLCGAMVVLWPDNDPPDATYPDGKGQAHMEQVARILIDLPVKPKMIRMMDVSKLGLKAKGDAYDFVQREGDSALSKVKAAIRNHSFEFNPRDEIESFLDKLDTGELRPIEWPYMRLTKKAAPSTPGKFSMLVGEPGAGKSLMILEAAQDWMERHVPFALYALEDDLEFHIYRALAQRIGDPRISDREWQSDNSGDLRRVTKEHRGFIDLFKRNITTNPDKSVKQDDVLRWIERMADRGRRVIVVDPITAIDLQGKEQSVADQKFIMAAKQIANERSVSVIAVTHPKKETKGIVSAESVAGGASLLRFCHCMMWLQKHYPTTTSLVDNGMARIELEHNITAHVLKSRGTDGQGAKIAMNFSSQDLKFWERGYVCSKEKKEGGISKFEQRAIAASQQMRAPMPPVEQTYQENEENDDVF